MLVNTKYGSILKPVPTLSSASRTVLPRVTTEVTFKEWHLASSRPRALSDNDSMNKKDLSERDICTKFIIPALVGSGWTQNQFREEVRLTDGRVIVRGKLAYRLQNHEKKRWPQTR